MKRFLDVILSSLALLALAPLIAVICILIRLSMGGPVIFTQRRPGRAAQSFKMRKFRTMKLAVGPTSHHSGDDDPRVSSVGRWIRKFKIDEPPQLWNIVKGEMSFVGPRPESPDYTKLYTKEQMAILELRPGITDFASIEFADLGSLLKGDDPDKLYFEKVWDRKMDLRMKYVQERSFWVDLKLIFLTLAAIFSRNK